MASVFRMYGGPSAHARLAQVEDHNDLHKVQSHFAGITVWACDERPQPTAPQPSFWIPKVSRIEFNPLFTSGDWHPCYTPLDELTDDDPLRTWNWECREVRLRPETHELLRQDGEDRDTLRAMYLTQPPITTVCARENSGTCLILFSNEKGVAMGDVFDNLDGRAKSRARTVGDLSYERKNFENLWCRIVIAALC
ncbi:uncharacterized protein K452DRAFT_321561 [Aplosporella prunicola CBS 121167]|uniref:Uncharacterized protein n=1 Tax=Aplosporella prunicola CBS 121167 TaxID=1176127 RepID=A0A6A6B5B9_9PEZI|nr:uncharacterized protein K452DRAFT_321561 [Aplosporella prunicola CBS 121167]KAF2137941.1 hypothetical protein K452DRAFT_321561 [Aplosporella prunicola CBS 121167]